MKVSYFARYGKSFNVSKIEKSLKGQRYFSENIGDLDYRLLQ